MPVTVEIESEEALSKKPARVLVCENGKVVKEIIAKIEYNKGADSRYYPCVILEEQK